MKSLLILFLLMTGVAYAQPEKLMMSKLNIEIRNNKGVPDSLFRIQQEGLAGIHTRPGGMTIHVWVAEEGEMYLQTTSEIAMSPARDSLYITVRQPWNRIKLEIRQVREVMIVEYTHIHPQIPILSSVTFRQGRYRIDLEEFYKYMEGTVLRLDPKSWATYRIGNESSH